MRTLPLLHLFLLPYFVTASMERGDLLAAKRPSSTVVAVVRGGGASSNFAARYRHHINYTPVRATTSASTLSAADVLRQVRLVCSGPVSIAAAVCGRRHLAAFRTPLLCAAIYGVGDVIAQNVERRGSKRRGPLDARRIANSGVIGFCWAGYVTPMVYGFADRTVPGLSVLNVLQKTCISIGVLGTVGNYCNMFSRRLLGGERPAVAMAATNADFRHVLVEDLKIWPAYDACIYAFVPIQIRPYINAVAACFWSSYISLVSAKAGVL